MNKLTPTFSLLLLTASAVAQPCTPPDGFTELDGTQTWPGSSHPVTLVNLWAVWCPPCLKELPMLDRIANADDYAIDTIHLGDNPEAIDTRYKQLGIRHLAKTTEPDLARLHQLGFQGLPASMVVINNRISYRYAGYIQHDGEYLQAWLNCLSHSNRNTNREER
ncbi:TlpA disulfide reductase family protein [Vibrio sp. CAU 1672]|uniref:TlpA family protein disulfide reductase n=1 Tax=Vibrio sp. CAU 1672 TaxID=3032594 RepID=UPI0023DA5487|nr:TlpA disulfide reductase family protein [Vibrio sp. CAU 1672]MDF2154615.1 TlpA disulfide reductase family protein [Vibrio sp. CAU 1672]